MPTPEEMQVQIDSLTTKVGELEVSHQAVVSDKNALAEQVGTMKSEIDKANADLIVAQQEPFTLRSTIDTMKDTEVGVAIELEAAKAKVAELDTMASKLADITAQHTTSTEEVDHLRGRVRATTIGGLVARGLREDNLKDKDLPALEAIASALEGQEGMKPVSNGLGLGGGEGDNVASKALTPIEQADRELAALRPSSN